MTTWPTPGGFADRMIRAKQSGTQVREDIGVLSLEHLEYFMFLTITSQQSRGIAADVDSSLAVISLHVLRFFLGDAWVNANCGTDDEIPMPQYVEGREFLKTDNTDDQNLAFRRQFKLALIAECLFNLQEVPGFAYRVWQMQFGGLSAAYGELICAKLIASKRPRFIIPSGKKGQDYDSEIVTVEGRTMCCEVKTKREDTQFGISTVRNTLEDARTQLPKDRPGIIFLNTPEHWLSHDDFSEIIRTAIAKVLRQSDRLVAILFTWVEWGQVFQGRITASKYDFVCNNRSSHYKDDIPLTLNSSGTINNQNWIKLDRYVKTRLPELLELLRANGFIEAAVPAPHREQQSPQDIPE